MITIEQELEGAVLRNSRAPAFSVVVEDVAIDFEEVGGIDDDTYTVRRVLDGGSYYACSGYKRFSPYEGIYFRRMTSVTQTSDWNAAWDTFLPYAWSGGSGLRADFHTMAVDGDDIVIAYFYNYPTSTRTRGIKGRRSTDGGLTWTSEYTIGYVFDELLDDYGIEGLAFADIDNLFAVAKNNDDGRQVFCHVGKSAGYWQESKWWDNGKYWLASQSDLDGRRLNAFINASGEQVLLINSAQRMMDGETSENGVYRTKYVYGDVGGLFTMYEEALGGYVENQDHQYLLVGPMQQFGDHFFSGVIDVYKSRADEEGYDTTQEFLMGKTKDGLSFELVPMDLLFGTDEPVLHLKASKFYNFVAGMVIAENGTQICMPVCRTKANDYDTSMKVYLCNYNSWFNGTDAQVNVTSSVLNPVSISHAVRSAASSELALTNKDDVYTDHAVVKSGAGVTIAAGYEGRLQNRFVGTLLGSSDEVAVPKSRAFKVFDKLQRASRVKQSRPHLIKGQNVFHLGFEDEEDIDQLVNQLGTWTITDGKLVQSMLPDEGYSYKDCMILAGYEPDSAYLVETTFEFSGDMSLNAAGIVLRVNNQSSNSTPQYDWILVWYSVYNQRLELRSMGERFGKLSVQSLIAYSSPIYMSEGTAMDLAVSCRGGNICVYWKWHENIREDDWYNYEFVICEEGIVSGSFKGYVGLYSRQNQDTVLFHHLSVFSCFPPKTGSDAMGYLARISGMDTDEIYAVNETFTDDASLSSEWDTTIAVGEWYIVENPTWYGSGTFATARRWNPATGWQTDEQYLLLPCSVSATDIIVRANIALTGLAHNETVLSGGAFVRGSSDLSSCYAGFIHVNHAYIMKKIDGDWKILIDVKWPPTWDQEAYGSSDLAEQRETDNINLAFSARGPFLSLFVDNILVAWAHDTELEDEGLVGMLSRHPISIDWPGCLFKSFTIDAFYKPIDTIVVRPGDNVISIMNQLADLYDGGQFFCNENGQLRWGVFNDTAIDLDTRWITTQMQSSTNLDKILTQVRVVGDNSFAEVRQIPWAVELGGHIYGEVKDESIDLRGGNTDRAESELTNSKKILEDGVSFRGHPGLELCDNVGVARSPELDMNARRVLGFTESISGSAYTMDLSQLETNEAQEP